MGLCVPVTYIDNIQLCYNELAMFLLFSLVLSLLSTSSGVFSVLAVSSSKAIVLSVFLQRSSVRAVCGRRKECRVRIGSAENIVHKKQEVTAGIERVA